MTPTSKRSISVVVIDDHQVFAESLARAIDSEADMRVIGVASGVAEGVATTRRLDPDVVLLDYALSDGSGIDALSRLRSIPTRAALLILTGLTDVAAFRSSVRAGAQGILSKTDGLEVVIEAIRAARQGSEILSPSVNRVLRSWSTPTALTDRELEVLEFVALGWPNRRIAESMYLSVNTVRNYVQRTLEKLGAHSRLEAVRIAMREGLVGAPRDSFTSVTKGNDAAASTGGALDDRR